jgi:hypothetical protein
MVPLYQRLRPFWADVVAKADELMEGRPHTSISHRRLPTVHPGQCPQPSSRPPIPVQAGHPFRCKPATDSGAFPPHCTDGLAARTQNHDSRTEGERLALVF